jgi:hypothetical protein
VKSTNDKSPLTGGPCSFVRWRPCEAELVCGQDCSCGRRESARIDRPNSKRNPPSHARPDVSLPVVGRSAVTRAGTGAAAAAAVAGTGTATPTTTIGASDGALGVIDDSVTELAVEDELGAVEDELGADEVDAGADVDVVVVDEVDSCTVVDVELDDVLDDEELDESAGVDEELEDSSDEVVVEESSDHGVVEESSEEL